MSLRQSGQSRALALAERVVTLPVLQWTWTGLGDDKFPDILSEIRPGDPETVPEMMSGRYLLGSKLVATGGASPFSIDPPTRGWRDELHGFSWLRHFRDVKDPGERRFARTLVLDWISRYGRYERDIWAIPLTVQRVMNLMRHFDLVVDGATADQKQRVSRSLASQIQSLRVRARLTDDPFSRLMARIAMLGAALCSGASEDVVTNRLRRLQHEMDEQVDQDGLHRSRNPSRQIEILIELASVRIALAKRQLVEQKRFGGRVEAMHKALASLIMGSGEIAYFNGCGQQPAEVVFALQSLSSGGRTVNQTLGGYGILQSGPALVIADSGRVPLPGFADSAHAGALSVEFSHGHELIFGNCGPAPAQLNDDGDLFRTGAAHSAPTLSGESAAWIAERGRLRGQLVTDARTADVTVDDEDVALRLINDGFISRFGVRMERRLTLLSDGDTLVGQDLFLGQGRKVKPADIVLRFHLGPGVQVSEAEGADVFRLTLPSGNQWSFLFEGTGARIEDSVRQSAHFGFYQTKQIVVETPLEDGVEVAWILTRV